MKKRFLILLSIAMLGIYTSCTDDLNTEPITQLTLEELLASDPNAVEGLVARLYASYALTGPSGPGSSDIVSPDAGEGAFLRAIINLQDFTADAMKNRWGDDGLDQLTTTSNWDRNNKFFRLFYDRAYYTIPQCNNFLQALDIADFPDEENIVAETRFLRALAYYNVIDVFGKGVLATEMNFGQSEPLQEATRLELFNYVESELLAIEPVIRTTSSYGRANRYVVDMLLAKLYINAEVYTGTPRWDDAATYVNKIINEGGYSLDSNFVRIFSSDNNSSPEIIFPLLAESLTSQSYGNTTYIVNGSLSADTMPLAQFGASGGWTGHRTTKAWYGLFGNSAADLGSSSDVRASLFWTTGHNYEMNDYREWTDGFPSTKFRNTASDGSGNPVEFSSTDFPFYRLSDVYLMYAELAIRGAAGTAMNDALTYVNNVRTRSNADAVGMSDLTLDFIIDERARELNLEGMRRSDLIRFNKFTGGNYLWPWKGGTAGGTAISDDYKLFPIPATALQANPNLTQNPGY
ncbi:RagB/SusD family nutrient uptake outer membrane protein [Winogradskyella eckloniae]|uniref:RagB/SusD family nutrient uptake outer membrane protein n=1 Tax=Winogradskyella eckloniae TaxID=1089306 RepID=UPI001566BC8B|nr:RagB/SusD family nutrient uptake outer membrane protein [Winogradskyella eckloniae]NRD19229.1 RagB/SusD family nutrient uptake outer membrane protein [Winogradskyella eckloniae]